MLLKTLDKTKQRKIIYSTLILRITLKKKRVSPISEYLKIPVIYRMGLHPNRIVS